VTVADVAWVKMLLPEDASLQVGLCMTVQLEAGDKDGHVFKSSQFPFMSIQVHVEDEVVAIKPRGDTTAPNEIVVCGANVGLTTTFHVSVQQHSGKKVVTDFARVSVYAPLSIHPSSLVLAPGAKYLLVIRGGPQTSVVVQFKTSHPEIATVDSVTGLLEAKGLGNLTVEAEVHSNSGELLSKAGSAVSVQVPTAMKLNVRGGQLAIGHEITIFPFGTEENLFSFFDQCSNYKWSIGDEQVLGLRTTDRTFVKYSRAMSLAGDPSERSNLKGERTAGTDDGFSARAIGRSAGRTLVTLSFSCIFHYGGQEEHREYTPSGTLWVVPDPPLALGMKATWVLPPDYTSSPLLPQRSKHFPVRTDAVSSGHNIVYSVMHEGDNDAGVVAILDKGRVHTSERMDVACIHARDHSTGRSEIATCIRVAEA
jgi:nuclear pore complex protein Nup210